MEPLFESTITSLPLLGRGKVQDIYAVDESRLLIVTSDRLSAFDVILPDPIPDKGRVLVAVSAFWFARLAHVVPNPLTGSDPETILNRTVRAVPGSSMTTTGPDSSFRLPLSAGTYELIVSPGAADVQGGTPYLVTVTNGVASPGHQLAMTATAPLHDLGGWGTMTPQPRPGFQTTITVFVTNTGNVRTDGTVDLSFDPLQQFVSSNPAAVLNGNTLSWDLATLELGEVVMLNATVLTPSNVPLGTQLVCTAQLTTPDDDPTNDTWTITPLVEGSYDPNDKRVTPETLTPQVVADGTPVTYTIRFQNTGTFLAEHVRLVDTLPAELDPTTLTFIGSTHPCTSCL